ncbi:MAG: hypothetical protein ACTSXV_01085 [Alphaproteobacteria bacterium]
MNQFWKVLNILLSGLAIFLGLLSFLIWLFNGDWLCFIEEINCTLFNIGYLTLLIILLILFYINKKGWILLFASVLFLLYGGGVRQSSISIKRRDCASDGGCLDYNNHCEKHDQRKCTPENE